MTGRSRGIAVGHLVPLRARAHHPENPIQHVAGIAPRPTASIGTPSRLWEERFDPSPLRIGEVHAQAPRGSFPQGRATSSMLYSFTG